MQHGSSPLIVSWGELVWDEHERPEGALSTLGGCACASAAHAAALGAHVRLVSAVGDDSEGAAALELLRERGLSCDWIQTLPEARTARVRVSHTAEGPRYSPIARLAWQSVDFAEALKRALRGADGLMFTLFIQGSEVRLEQLRRALAESGRPRLVGCDLNLRHAVARESLQELAGQADFVKLNQLELERLRTISGGDPIRFLLERKPGPRCVIETRAAAGARLSTLEGHFDVAAPTVDAGGDGVGAGDAFMAAFTVALLEGEREADAVIHAVRYASEQVTRRGAMPAFQNRKPGAPR